MGGGSAAGSGKAKRVGASSTTASIGGRRSSALRRDCACRALVALARKRSTKACMWARWAAIFSFCAACCACRSARRRVNSPKPPE